MSGSSEELLTSPNASLRCPAKTPTSIRFFAQLNVNTSRSKAALEAMTDFLSGKGGRGKGFCWNEGGSGKVEKPWVTIGLCGSV